MTSDEVIAAFGRLKTGSRDGLRLPHKPLLALLALGRLASGDHGPIPFPQVEKPLSVLLQAYGPKGTGNPQEPFWRLRRDGVWELGGTGHLAAPDTVSPPGLKELRVGVTGRFAADVGRALGAEPGLVNRLARALLDDHFAPSLQPGIADAVGLDLSAPPPLVPTANRRARDPKFRERVLTAYGNRCALCGVKLHRGLTPSALGVEAAHLRWFAFDGPDSVNNGVALCALHHIAFDPGAFTAAKDWSVSVSEEVNGDGADVLLRGERLSLGRTACQEDRPAQEFLAWHPCFRRVGRLWNLRLDLPRRRTGRGGGAGDPSPQVVRCRDGGRRHCRARAVLENVLPETPEGRPRGVTLPVRHARPGRPGRAPGAKILCGNQP
jgi:putative restriction endonuclease